jgi:hypothetical protein
VLPKRGLRHDVPHKPVVVAEHHLHELKILPGEIGGVPHHSGETLFRDWGLWIRDGGLRIRD